LSHSDRLNIAVFIDFDNIEIGVRTTLNEHFDIGPILDAIKERGEVVTKIAYADWTRAGEYSRHLTQHAIRLVQRNLTPGGDKNGADINLALDALEMVFTHPHINAYVIVGGDSDFLSLVEKLKQYDRKVFVVGGRSFTSQVMQKNCTEFVAYEDILGVTSRGRQAGGRTSAVTDIAAAMPLIRRALKLLADREVTPQLGLLKSTLLQLDSSFSERAYGASSFRDFIEKLAKAGHVALKGADRSFHVELRETGDPAAAAAGAPAEPQADRAPRAVRASRSRGHGRDARTGQLSDGGTGESAEAAAAPPRDASLVPEAALAEGGARPGPVDGYRIMVQAFSRPGATPRFPMYVRQVKQFIKTFDGSFDERRYGFAGMLDALRFGQREGLFRLDRDRQGGVRVHPGAQYLTPAQASEAAPAADGLATGKSPQGGPLPLGVEAVAGQDARLAPEPRPASAPRDAEDASPVPSSEVPSTDGAAAPAPAEPAATPRGTGRKRTGTRAAPRAKKTAPPSGGAKKKAARPRAKKA
jgi:uncharacterized LabA/DUF88 family protein